jgi:hypothetical protein
VWRETGANFDGSGGTENAIKGWTNSAAVETGLGDYNTFKIVRNGSTYTYYLNNKLITSFTDATHNPTYIMIVGYNGSTTTQLNYDYAYVDVGSTAGSVPGPAVKITQTTKSERSEYHK